MADIFTSEKRSEIMSRIKGKNTKPELALFELVRPLWKVCRYRKHHPSLPGNPDLVFPKAKLAIFVDGAFWHGKDFEKVSRNWHAKWKNKIKENMQRDRKVNSKLNLMGYKTLRFWDDDVLRKKEKVFSEIQRQIAKRKH